MDGKYEVIQQVVPIMVLQRKLAYKNGWGQLAPIVVALMRSILKHENGGLYLIVSS